MGIKTPPLYATGRWILREPFEVDPDAIYVCKGIRSLDDLRARGLDPFVNFYEIRGIDRETYNQDTSRLVNIITLMSDTYPTIYVPDTYIESYPDTTTVPYSHVVLSISLGAVPDTLVFDDLKEKIEDLVLNNVGVQAEIKEHQANVMAEGITQTRHQMIERNRLARIQNNVSSYARIRQLQDTNERLVEQIRRLERIIIDRGLLET